MREPPGSNQLPVLLPRQDRVRSSPHRPRRIRRLVQAATVALLLSASACSQATDVGSVTTGSQGPARSRLLRRRSATRLHDDHAATRLGLSPRHSEQSCRHQPWRVPLSLLPVGWCSIPPRRLVDGAPRKWPERRPQVDPHTAPRCHGKTQRIRCHLPGRSTGRGRGRRHFLATMLDCGSANAHRQTSFGTSGWRWLHEEAEWPVSEGHADRPQSRPPPGPGRSSAERSRWVFSTKAGEMDPGVPNRPQTSVCVLASGRWGVRGATTCSAPP